MALIKWTEEMKTTIDSVDLQHKKLIELINNLYEAMQKGGANKDLISKIFLELASYTKSHFANEEKYFDQYNYPHAAEHKKEHASFISKVSELQSQLSSGKLTISIDTLKFLVNWLNEHIMKTDKKYVPCLKENGAK